MSLTKDQILAAEDLPREEVDVPEWGGSIWVRAMTGESRDSLEAEILDEAKPDLAERLRNARAKLCARTICDENGELLFAESDIGALGGKSAAALDRAYTAALKLNALRDIDVEDMAKNSPSGQGDGSASV